MNLWAQCLSWWWRRAFSAIQVFTPKCCISSRFSAFMRPPADNQIVDHVFSPTLDEGLVGCLFDFCLCLMCLHSHRPDYCISYCHWCVFVCFLFGNKDLLQTLYTIANCQARSLPHCGQARRKSDWWHWWPRIWFQAWPSNSQGFCKSLALFTVPVW